MQHIYPWFIVLPLSRQNTYSSRWNTLQTFTKILFPLLSVYLNIWGWIRFLPHSPNATTFKARAWEPSLGFEPTEGSATQMKAQFLSSLTISLLMRCRHAALYWMERKRNGWRTAVKQKLPLFHPSISVTFVEQEWMSDHALSVILEINVEQLCQSSRRFECPITFHTDNWPEIVLFTASLQTLLKNSRMVLVLETPEKFLCTCLWQRHIYPSLVLCPKKPLRLVQLPSGNLARGRQKK